MTGTGEASGQHRAAEAAEAATTNPLLDDISLDGARGLLINISGGPDLTMHEVQIAAEAIQVRPFVLRILVAGVIAYVCISHFGPLALLKPCSKRHIPMPISFGELAKKRRSRARFECRLWPLD